MLGIDYVSENEEAEEDRKGAIYEVDNLKNSISVCAHVKSRNYSLWEAVYLKNPGTEFRDSGTFLGVGQLAPWHQAWNTIGNILILHSANLQPDTLHLPYPLLTLNRPPLPLPYCFASILLYKTTTTYNFPSHPKAIKTMSSVSPGSGTLWSAIHLFLYLLAEINLGVILATHIHPGVEAPNQAIAVKVLRF